MASKRGAERKRASALASLSPALCLIIVAWLLADLNTVQTQPTDKPGSPTQIKHGTIVSHDNQILNSVSTFDSNSWDQSRAQLEDENHEGNLTFEDSVRKQPNPAHHRRTLRRRHRRSNRSNLPAQELPKSTTDKTSLRKNSEGTTESWSTTLGTTSASSAASNSTQKSTLNGYATVNYNGLTGINATDPYKITPESGGFSLPFGIQVLMCLLYGTLAFTAVTSNLIVCYIVLSNQRMRTATNYFIVNLAVGDILMALLCIPFTFPANMIYQFWPFGLTLCVIVSYSQANSVFVSAYTMVAISIDKYIAILHPMRLRMPKNQAKVIILVIWSAALLTSLPTALLSNLVNRATDTSSSEVSSTIETKQSQQAVTANLISSVLVISTEGYNLSESKVRQELNSDSPHEVYARHALSLRPNDSSSESNESMSKETTTPQIPEQKQYKQQYQEYYTCEETWNFWPKGKYYYSMTLMVLQFVVPLFVLVVTYTRIVVVVWGKRMPGEEDNARDARMARSKRKMIKMVIFCVIAFVLCWSPFNALILIGEIVPDIWTHKYIGYIWFTTHYLAMCHTITNPLIYIWMNNRFRAGFIQVIGIICKLIHIGVAYILCHCFCLGCCLDCSRRKYASIAHEYDRKHARRVALASSGSINPYVNNNANNHLHHAAEVGQTTGTTGLGGLTANHCCTRANSSSQSTANTSSKRTTASGNTSSTSRGVEGSIKSRAQPTRVSKFRTNPVSSLSGDDGTLQQLQQSEHLLEGEHIELGTIALTSSNNGDYGDQVGANEGPSCLIQSAIKSTSGQRCTGLFQRKKRCQTHRNDPARSELDSNAGTGQTLATKRSDDAVTGAKKKRRRRQTHAVCLQMTTAQTYSAQVSMSQLASGLGAASAQAVRGTTAATSVPGSKKRSPKFGARIRARLKRPIDYPHDCRQASVNAPSVQPSKDSLTFATHKGGCVQFGQFLVDAPQSSQSTATISAHTNNTSLAISPISSTKGASNGCADAGVGHPVSVSNSNNTSASLSANGLAGDHFKDCSGNGNNHGEVESRGGPSSDDNGGGEIRACYNATDDDADDNSINGNEAAYAKADGSSNAPRVDMVKSEQMSESEGILMRFDRPISSESNNLKLAVSVKDGDYSTSFCQRRAGLLRPASVHAFEVSADSNPSRRLTPKSPLSLNGVPIVEHRDQIDTRLQQRSTLGERNISFHDEHSRIKLTSPSVEGKQQQETEKARHNLQGCNQPVGLIESQRAMPLCRHRLRLGQRQTASAMEVDQLRQKRDSCEFASTRICTDENDTFDACQDLEVYVGEDKQLRHLGVLRAVNNAGTDDKLKGVKSKSALELMSDHKLRGQRTRPDCWPDGSNNNALGGTDGANHANIDDNDGSDDDEDDDDDSEQPLSPWGASDIEQVPIGYDGNYSMEEEMENEHTADDGPDCVRLMLLRPTSGPGTRIKSKRTATDTGHRRNGFLSRPNLALDISTRAQLRLQSPVGYGSAKDL